VVGWAIRLSAPWQRSHSSRGKFSSLLVKSEPQAERRQPDSGVAGPLQPVTFPLLPPSRLVLWRQSPYHLGLFELEAERYSLDLVEKNHARPGVTRSSHKLYNL
jgi:hypothetical protein